MAGIGFTLRRLNPHQSFGGILRQYGTAGLISAGPWLLSILGILLIGLLSVDEVDPPKEVVQFQVSVTYLFATSLVTTGFLQLMFTRYVADRLFEHKEFVVTPNLLGTLTLTAISSGVLATAVSLFGFSEESALFQIELVTAFVILSCIWMAVVLLTGLKAYDEILITFFVGYAATVILALSLTKMGLEGLLFGFVGGQALLLFLLLLLLLRHHPGDRLVSFDFLNRSKIFPRLAVIGFLYNFGIWVDKFMFWFNPDTSHPVIGLFRASTIYDVPIFLAYLTVMPGMAVFLVRMETDFAELYEAFYDQVREGATLQSLERTRNNMIYTVSQGMYEIFKVQGLTLLLVYLFGPQILAALNISPLYLNLFYIDATAVGAQVILLSVLNVLYYLDLQKLALRLCLFFALSNVVLTAATQMLGPSYYGYGFAAAVVLTSLIGLAVLSKELENLVNNTFMLYSVRGSV